MSGGVQGITEADIADYLVNTPGFFERHAELLGSVQLTSPHGQRAVSLQERQMEMLRDKIRGLEGRIVDMIRYGQDNVSLADRLHRWTRALMMVREPVELPARLVDELMHQFIVPQAGIRLWGTESAFASQPFAVTVSEDVKLFAASLALPYSGVNSGFEAAQWLDEPTAARSMAMIPLRAEPAPAVPAPIGGSAERVAPRPGAFGMLVLASPDPTRYTADMGTEFLGRIGELASAALARLLPARGVAV